MYILASFLAVGFICNALIRPVAKKWLITRTRSPQTRLQPGWSGCRRILRIGLGGGLDAKTILAWAAVCIPLAWGVWKTLDGAVKMFQ